MTRRITLLISACLALAACAQTGDPPTSEPTPTASEAAGTGTPTETPTVVGSAPVADDDTVSTAATEPAFVPLLAVGDIASCDRNGDEKVAKLAQERRGRVAILGDSAYPSGSAEEFAQCFDPAWGSMAARLRPTPGNHEYRSAGAEPYFDYYGDYTGGRGKGWYAFNLGDHWRVIVLNSNCTSVGCGSDSPQGRWLARAVDNAGNRHIVAYWHHPLYSSGAHGPSPSVKPLFRMLYRGGADIVLNGHDHNYERFAPQNHRGDRRRAGIQQFVVGTGGYSLRPFESPLKHSVVRDATSFGLLKLRLKPDGYSWSFIPSEGSFTDSGSRPLN